MKQKIRFIVPIIFAALIMVKSWLFLSMLRTDGVSRFNLGAIYFSPTAYWAHIAMVVILVSFAYLFKDKNQIRYLIIVDILFTMLIFLDLWYFRVNAAFPSIKDIIDLRVFNPLNISLLNPRAIDITFIFDFILIGSLYAYVRYNNKTKYSSNRNIIMFAVLLIVSSLVIYISHIKIDDVENSEYILFSKSWAPFQQMSNMSPLGYCAFDIVDTLTTTNKTQLNQNKVSKEDIESIDNWLENNKENLPDNSYKGIYKGNNVIYIQVESLENWVINTKINGQEITPNLNKLLNNSIYFNNIYQQNKKGFSSDADLMSNTSIYPSDGSTFYDYTTVKLNSMSRTLTDQGYNTISTHPERGGGWNWAEAHSGILGVKNIWTVDKFDIDEVIGLGISDGSYLRQVSEKLKNVNNPYYAFMVTLTSHGDFELPEKYKYITLPNELHSTVVGDYVETIRYTDQQIGNFIESLKNNGTLDNTTVVIYGDHTILHREYQDRLDGMTSTGPWTNDDIKIPLIMYNPKTKAETNGKSGGLVDVMPTVLYMIGNDRSDIEKTSMGRILVNTDRDSTFIFNDQIRGVPKTEAEKEHVEKSYEISDKIFKTDYFVYKGMVK